MHETSSLPIAELRSRVHHSRKRQGLPGCVTDPAILSALANLLKGEQA